MTSTYFFRIEEWQERIILMRNTIYLDISIKYKIKYYSTKSDILKEETSSFHWNILRTVSSTYATIIFHWFLTYLFLQTSESTQFFLTAPVSDSHANLLNCDFSMTTIFLFVPDSSLFPIFWIKIPLRLLRKNYHAIIHLTQVILPLLFSCFKNVYF